MKCYFDKSGGGKWLTLGGIAAPDVTWTTLNRLWEAMLSNRDPIAPYVHMTDLITNNGPFERNAGWDRSKVDCLVSDIETVLKSIPARDLCAFACSIDISARKRLVAEGYRIAKPEVICAEAGFLELLRWHTNCHPLEPIHLFYDRGEPFIGSIQDAWRSRVKPGRLTNELAWGRIASIQPVSMCDTPGIQAADVIAWAFTRRLRYEPRDDRWASLANTLIGRIGEFRHPGLLTATQIAPITEDVMREKYPKTQ